MKSTFNTTIAVLALGTTLAAPALAQDPDLAELLARGGKYAMLYHLQFREAALAAH